MSRQLSFSATVSALTMTLFALSVSLSSLGGSTGADGAQTPLAAAYSFTE